MKKTLIVSAIALSALSFAFAKDTVTVSATASVNKGKPVAVKPELKKQEKASTTDALGLQIKSLNMEMEAKIKSIRDEYQAKIKALIASTTPMMRRDDKGTSTDDRATGSSTDKGRRGGEVRGAEIENTTEVQVQESGVMHFFRGLFGNK